jgi:putative transposase
MRLVEQHTIKQSDYRFKELDNLCFLSKNLYNSGLYAVRQHFFKTKKYLSFPEIAKQFAKENQADYRALPTKVSQQTLKMVEQNFKSFFASIKTKDRKVKIPKYLNKENGKYMLIYTIQAISKTMLKKNIVKLSGTGIEIKTGKNNIQQARVIHKGNHIVVEVVYLFDEPNLKENNNRYCGIDLGLNNLATIGSNVLKPLIINGKPLKSINRYYNKKLAYYKSKLENENEKKYSKRIKSLTNKRNGKVKDYLHKSSRYIVDYLVSNQINTLVIGLNKGWKQKINIGKKNNQKFVQIPYNTLINMVSYKAKMVGIDVKIQNESHTSKCDFLSNEEVKHQKEYKGRRIKRGLFKSATGKFINSDLNGALNIIKKAIGEFQYPIEVCSTPLVINYNDY